MSLLGIVRSFNEDLQKTYKNFENTGLTYEEFKTAVEILTHPDLSGAINDFDRLTSHFAQSEGVREALVVSLMITVVLFATDNMKA